MNTNNNYCVIMAGGIGARFWPYSKNSRPKQFLDFFGTGRSLIQLTFDRFRQVVPVENILIVSNRLYKDLILEQLPELKSEQVLLEPMRRNTAPCIYYAVSRIKSKTDKANIIVAPSDHLILNEVNFLDTIRQGLDFVEQNDALLTLGIKPSRPETGYGYIQADLTCCSPRNKEIYRVDSFKEKPNLETAQKYIAESRYFWNAGIFIWSVRTVVNAFRIYQPSLANIFESIADVYGTENEQKVIDERFPECENISVDYAIMEKAEEIFVCPASFGWSDLGTWGSLWTQTKHDLMGNSLIGNGISTFETRNCIIHTTENKQVVVQGLDGYIVAEKDGRLLICKLSEEQRIKQFSGQN